MPTEQASGDSTTAPPARSASDALDLLLAANPGALVAAIGSDGGLGPVPSTLPLEDHQAFRGTSGIDLVVPEDQMVIIEAWARAQAEPIVRFDVHLRVAPDHLATIHIFDARPEHGTFVAVIETNDPHLVIEAADALAGQRRGAAHVKRDAMAVFLEADEATTALLGWSPADLVGRRTLDLVHPDDVERAIESWMSMRSGTGGTRMRLRLRHADGHYVWLEVTHDNQLDDPVLACVVSEMVDISVEMAELEALHDRERMLQRLAEALPIGICHLHLDGQVAYSNAPLVALLGPVDSVESMVRSVAGPDRQLVATAVERATYGRPGTLEVGILHGYEERRCELTFRPLTGDSGSVDGVIVCAADVTDRSRLRSELEHRASHDALSGCLNRAATVTMLERALREHRQVAVAYIDLDNFKSINDELGHAAGDELLRVAAARLRSVTRVDDRLGRIGGDEFVVICPRGDGPFEAAALAERLTEAICGDVTFARQRIPLRASVGAAVSLDGELDAEALLSRADAAMYEVKRRSRRQVSGLEGQPVVRIR